MLEFVGSGLFGGLMGGLFRLAPEVLKFWDRHSERKHELAMFQEQISLEKVKGSFKVEEKYVDFSVEQLKANAEAFKEQSETASKSYKWVAALSALVRPTVTYVLFGMYVAVKFTFISHGLSTGSSWHEVLVSNWTPDDFAMLNGILMFWFLGRTIPQYQHKG
jgi:hypothetical protein